MKTIDLFRMGVIHIINNIPNILQKDIAIKLNDLHASEKTAATDLNDFLRGRKLYSLDKQERLAQILGYSHFEILVYGEKVIENTNKIKNFKKEKQRKIMLKNGTFCSIGQILKMTEDFLLCDIKEVQIQKSMLIEKIMENWKILLSMKKERINR